MVQSGRLFVRIFDRLVRSGFAGAKLSSRDDRSPKVTHRFDHLLNLPEAADIGAKINDANFSKASMRRSSQ